MVYRSRVLAGLLTAAVVLVGCGSSSPSPSAPAESEAAESAAPTPLSLADLAHAVVQILLIVDDNVIGTGSGTIID
ncbi:MAG: hypothetical protein M3P32_01510, partial [Chloroflexota bacterium]|nr:hypothetical protein [Chloroflexota bacterium]